jgi:serine/threonine-protein kinase
MKKPDQQTCFEDQTLSNYLNEKLDESSETQIQDHLSQCSDCQQKLERVAGNPTVWKDLRKNFPMGNDESTVVVSDDRIQRVLEMLGPTDDPNMLGRLGNCEVSAVIGQGSTGVVLKAYEPRLNRFVAIKVLSPSFSAKGAARQRFEREGRAVAAVMHENIVPIFAVDEHQGWPFIVMQYIPGFSLLQRIEKKGPLNTCEVTRIGFQVAKGLAAAHNQGVVHRDVKPANVMLESTVDRAMVTDFGLARVADEASMTQSGIIAGTPQYMSPEQAKGQTVDHRSDLFSLGSLMYAACTARPPFRAETLYGVIHRVCNSEPRAIREINPSIEPWLCDFISCMMSKNKEARIQTAAEVAENLSAELACLQSPMTTPQPARPWMPTKAKSEKVNTLAGWRFPILAMTFVLVGVAIFTTQFGKNLGIAGWLTPEKAKVETIGPKDPNRDLTHPFFQQDQDLEISDEPTITWRPMENDWDTGTRAPFEQKWQQAFAVKPNKALSIDADIGEVVILPNETDDRLVITLMRRVTAASQGEAEKTLENHLLNVKPTRKGFQIIADLDDDFAMTPKSLRLEKILIRVSVPRNYDAEVELANGNISVGELNGDATVKTEMGRIQFDRIGGNIDVQGSGGCIDLRAGCGGKAEVLCVNGDVYFANGDQESKIMMSGGKVWLGGCKGDVYAQTSGGNIEVENLIGKVGAYALDGDVDVLLSESPSKDCSFGATLGNLNIRMQSNVAANVKLPDTFDFGEMGDSLPDSEKESGWAIRSFNEGGATIEGDCDSGEVNFVFASQVESLGGSGGQPSLGGSGTGLCSTTFDSFKAALQKTSTKPQPGRFATIATEDVDMDGYTLYLPVSHAENKDDYPILVSLQGSWGVGGEIESVNLWGLNRLIRDENDLSNERNQLVLDSFIVVSPHIKQGSYSDHPDLVRSIIESVAEEFRGDLDRVYLTGLSRGGHGTWGLACKLKDMFAAIVPVAGTTNDVDDFSNLTKPAIWISHNTGDGSFEYSEAAVEKLEDLTDTDFLKIESVEVSGTDYLDHRYVFVTPDRNHHDAWTELYLRPEVYQWLLKQTK